MEFWEECGAKGEGVLGFYFSGVRGWRSLSGFGGWRFFFSIFGLVARVAS